MPSAREPRSTRLHPVGSGRHRGLPLPGWSAGSALDPKAEQSVKPGRMITSPSAPSCRQSKRRPPSPMTAAAAALLD